VSVPGGLPPRRPDQYTAPGGAPAMLPAPSQVTFAREVIVYGPAGAVSGVFVYSGATPALGDLIASVSNSAADRYGNTVLPVIAVYGADGQAVDLAVAGSFAAANFRTGTATEEYAAVLLATGQNSGDPSEFQLFELYGPQSSAAGAGDRVIQLMSGSAANNPGSAEYQLYYQDTSGADHSLLTAGANGLFRLSLAGLQGGLPACQMDTFSRTVTQAVATGLTPAYGIPADDAVTDGGASQYTTYKIHCSGYGDWGNPATSLQLGLNAMGVDSLLGIEFAAGDLAAGDGFNFIYDAEVTIVSTGAAGSMQVEGFVTLNNQSTVSQVYSGPLNNRGAVACDTTVAQTMQVLALWGSASDGATITCPKSNFYREGS
jgi:hypothetical protein